MGVVVFCIKRALQPPKPNPPANRYVHGDVKPENFLMGFGQGPTPRKLYLIDLGLGACMCVRVCVCRWGGEGAALCACQ